jgi:hypothetical protein
LVIPEVDQELDQLVRRPERPRPTR